jgi:excisionase family DNA binding protein
MSIKKRLINIQELAEYTGNTVGTLYVWIHQRKIPYIKWGRNIRFDLNEIDKFIENHRIPAKESFDFDD